MKNHHLTQEQIRARAYEIYVQRGCRPGHAAEDWSQAERELLQAANVPAAALGPAEIRDYRPERLAAAVSGKPAVAMGKKRQANGQRNKLEV